MVIYNLYLYVDHLIFIVIKRKIPMNIMHTIIDRYINHYNNL